jgi:hypothetical protein
VPNIDFWRELPALVRDGVRLITSKVCGRGSSGGDGAYQDVK